MKYYVWDNFRYGTGNWYVFLGGEIGREWHLLKKSINCDYLTVKEIIC